MNKFLPLLIAVAAPGLVHSAPAPRTPKLDPSEWKIASVDGKATVPWDAAGRSARISFAGGRASGSTGCNAFSGTYVRRGQILSFSQMISTQMACIDEDGGPPETEIFELLASRVRMQFGRDGTLTLSTPKHRAVLRRAIAGKARAMIAPQWIIGED
jgi:heat shock protein HslJ